MRRLSAILIADIEGFSSLVETDEDAVLNRQQGLRDLVIDPAISDAGGQVVKSTGDGFLAEFASVRAAIECAIALQQALAETETARPETTRLRYRMGLHAGDVTPQGDDLMGDTVNLAARLESLSAAGGLCISDAAWQMLPPGLQDGFSDLGIQRVHNLARPVRVWQWRAEPQQAFSPFDDEAQAQKIGFCAAPDGVMLAHAEIGSGPTVFKAPNWINHLDYDWRSPIAGPGLARIARHHRLVRFDQRGNGLSDWDVDELSEDSMISDMDAVVQATGLASFALFGQSQGCAFSIRYAAENPDKVACLVLLGGYARGALCRGAPEQAALHQATNTLIREGWGSANPAYRNVFTESMIPEASPQQKAQWDERQRVTTSPANAARINDMNAHVDVSALARKVTAPALVFHAEGDRRIPLDEGRRMAALLPNSEFIALPGSNHILIEGTEAFDIFHEQFRLFVARHLG
ncbi:alpha/beta fold hydrolase [Sedimentitalea sp. JM2-8]|uniref:Alpha/beta fold hydrolase n=1 Tax=Sedimentitalea xiamensis TaxID=3050037 RepID=A0ABT7FAA2_9RHOB|nr:alpha/beta fold hydrolase [Sedimentitalea xiamensis]MDK3072038.1 alpha/beta fold hydrolase [Sedimentitalea xiamensis]